jgi:hypothetical protein
MAAAQVSATEAAEVSPAEATAKMAAAAETAGMPTTAETTTMAAATTTARHCGGRKRGATDDNRGCKNKDGFTQHDKLLLRMRLFSSLQPPLRVRCQS